jgi:hypothetical protein
MSMQTTVSWPMASLEQQARKWRTTNSYSRRLSLLQLPLACARGCGGLAAAQGEAAGPGRLRGRAQGRQRRGARTCGPAQRVGWMGGWALSSWPPPGGWRHMDPSMMRAAWPPQRGSCTWSATMACGRGGGARGRGARVRVRGQRVRGRGWRRGCKHLALRPACALLQAAPAASRLQPPAAACSPSRLHPRIPSMPSSHSPQPLAPAAAPAARPSRAPHPQVLARVEHVRLSARVAEVPLLVELLGEAHDGVARHAQVLRGALLHLQRGQRVRRPAVAALACGAKGRGRARDGLLWAKGAAVMCR